MPMVFLPGLKARACTSSWIQITSLVLLSALVVSGLIEASAEERYVYNGALVRIQPRTKAFSSLSRTLPVISAKGFAAERLTQQVIKLERDIFRSASLTAEESPVPYSRKTNPCRKATVRKALAALNVPLTACSPNWAQFSSIAPNDPGFSSQYAATLMSLQSAWDKTTGSDNVVVAVIDSGVSLTHPDLVSNLWINPREVAANGLDDDGNGYIDDVHGINAITGSGNPNDDNSHGTHVAGIVAASGNNSVGVAGVSWRAKIIGLKFLDAAGSGSTSNAIKCINYATQMKRLGHNVVSSNNSWGGGGYSSALASAIQDAANNNVLFIAAAGNSSKNLDIYPSYPASYRISNVISVASVTSSRALSYFSNYGTSVSIAAPGSSIYSTVPGGYASYSGTSMASPQVAGLTALASSMCQTPFTAAQLKDIILSTGVAVTGLTGTVGSGSIANGLGAILKAESLCSAQAPVAPTAAPTATHTVAPTRTATATATAPATHTATATASATATVIPTTAPIVTPTEIPTVAPLPSVAPIVMPAPEPSHTPTATPIIEPTIPAPPTSAPTRAPTLAPTIAPTTAPTRTPIPTVTAAPTQAAAITISPGTPIRSGSKVTVSVKNVGSVSSVPIKTRLLGTLNGRQVAFVCPAYSLRTAQDTASMWFYTPTSAHYFNSLEISTETHGATSSASVQVAQPRLAPSPRSSLQAKTQTFVAHARIVCNVIKSRVRASARRASRLGR